MNQHLRFALASSAIYSSVVLGQTLPAPKQAIAQQYALERAAGAQNPAPKNSNASYPIAVEPPFQTGILSDCSNPGSSQAYDISSCWAGIFNNTRTFVYTGAEAAGFDPTHGVAIAMTQPDYPLIGTVTTVLTPIKVGPIEIVAAQNSTLLMQSETQSYIFFFDLNTFTFTSYSASPATQVAAGQLSVTTSGLAYSRVSQTFNGTVTVSNNGTNTLNAPINIVLSLLSNKVTLLNATGMTGGVPYITIPAVPTLAPRASVTFSVQFSNPSDAVINFTPTGYTGSFNN